MTKTDFVHVLSDAIQQHEGWLADTGKSWPNLNPGNLKFAHQQFATESPDGFAVFGNFYNGKQAQLNDLEAKIDAGHNTIEDILGVYAPSSDGNDVAAYVQSVIAFLAARNIPIGAEDPIDQFIANFKNPVVLVSINQIYAPDDWSSVHQSIAQCAAYMPAYAFSCRYSNADLSKDIIQVKQVYPAGSFSGVSAAASRQTLSSYNQGQVLNVLIYSGTIMQGAPEPWGGCEYQGIGEPNEPVSAVCSVMYQGPVFTDPTARILFHELIHELFDVTEQADDLHAYLIAHGGYPENLATDLEAVFAGNELNTPEAVSILEARKAAE